MIMHKKAVQHIFTNVPNIVQALDEAFDTFHSQDGRYPLDDEFYTQMKTFAKSGKLFRGCLLVSIYAELTGEKPSQGVIKVAAALELYCSGLLIQDDIMDRDVRRRGSVTTHITLEELANRQSIVQPAHFGTSIAMCFGDILFFLATQMIASTTLSEHLKLQLLTISNRELALLGLAQSEDMRMAGMPISQITKEEIIAMQYGKTGRYTGRWPLAMAASLAEMPATEVEHIAKVGEEIGLLYQLRDDYLGIFGNSEKTGKNAMSDIREGKKTLYYLEAYTTITGKDKKFVRSIFGNSSATDEEIIQLVSVLTEQGIVERVNQEVVSHTERVQQMIAELSVQQSVKKLLLDVVTLVVTREK
jgi:geranylgeranyl diphosphate synthase type I